MYATIAFMLGNLGLVQGKSSAVRAGPYMYARSPIQPGRFVPASFSVGRVRQQSSTTM